MLTKLVVLSVLLGIASAQGQDLTRQAGTNGSSVVSACISRIKGSDIFTSDNEMLRRIAYVETKFGNDADTYRSGYDGGIWAVDEDLFDKTQDTAAYSSLTSLHQGIQTKFSIQWSSVQWNDLRKPLYSALAARLFFYTVSTSIPISSNIQSQATYWVTNYNTSGSTSNFVTLVNELQALDECSVSGIDIYFVLDESGSVGSTNYQQMKQFAYNTVDEFDIGPDDTQVGLISYSSSATARFYLNTYHNKMSLLSAINGLPYNSGGTNTAAAIDLLRLQGFTSTNGGRPTSEAVPRIAVVITDGYSNSFTETVAAAQSAHNDQITIFAVGVGSNVNSDELDAIASDPSYVSNLDGFDTSQFEALQTTITNAACTTAAEVDINEVVDTTVDEGETRYIEVTYDPDEGVTIKVNVTNGSVIVYASDQTTTPNEAFYDWMIETDGYADVFLDPDDVNRTVGDSVYVAIEGEDPENDFTFITEEGDTSTSVPDAPENVAIGTITATSVSISWTSPTTSDTDDIIRYDIELSEEQFGLATVTTSTTETSVTVTGIEEYNTYGCKIAAVNNVGVGTFSYFVNFTTLEAAPSAAPSSPSGSAQSPTVITLEWDPPPAVDINGDIEYYVVDVEEVYTGRTWTFHAVDVHINIASLHAYYLYKCRVAAFTVEQGPFTSYFTVYSGEKAPTAAPENVTVVDDSPSSVDLSWDPPPYEMQNGRIRHYNIEITEVETGDVLEVTSNYTNITVSDLVPFYNYTCTISAETVADGPSSDEITFVLPEGPPDGAPENVIGSATNSTSIDLSWDTPARNLQNGHIVEYRVKVTETDTGTTTTTTTTDTSLTITSLHPHYVYSCSVAAITVGIGPYSTAINITTDEDVPSGAPQTFSASPTSPFEAYLSWSPPLEEERNGVIDNYVINITEDDTGDKFQVSTSTTTITLDENLRPYYVYTCVIAAETSVGVGPYSSNVSFRTHEYVPSEPQDVNVSRRSGEPNELQVTWNTPEAPNGVILNYTVYCDEVITDDDSGASGDDLFPDNSSFTTVVVTVSGNDLSVVVPELTPYTFYDCYVTADTSVGEGDSSTVESAQTDESEPGDAPTDFTSTVLNSTAIRLVWDKPLLPYGVILSYTITYNTSDGNVSRVVNSSEPRNVVIAQLQEHTWYRFEIVATTRIGNGPYATITTRTDISEPHEPPSNITFEIDSSTQATITWQPPPFEDQNGPILYYNLIISELVFGLDDIDVNISVLTYTATNLEEYNNYSFIIAAATEVGLGPYSSPINFTTEEDVPSAPPSDITGDVQSATFVIFSWEAPPAIDQNGAIQYYIVKVREIETNILWTFFAVDEDISIGSLHPYYYYDCTVAAHTSIGTGPYSTPIRVQTEEAAPSAPPLALTAEKTSDSLTLSWDPPANESQNGVIQRYVIRILEDDTSTSTDYYSSTTQITVSDLHPYYTYKCSVAAETVGVGPYTAILTVQLDEDSPTGAPVNPSGSSPSSTSISLSWSPPPFEHRNGIIRSYIILSTELETNANFSYTTLGTALTINSLHPYYRYRFTITAVTISSGPSTTTFTVRTQQDAPSSPAQNTSADGTTPTSISLSWEPPPDDQQNGVIVNYVVRVVPVDGGTTVYLNSTSTSVTVTSLRPYTTYDCSIAAETSAGRGPFSSVITVRTDEAAPSASPQNLTGTSVNSRAIFFSWSPPPTSDRNGVIREYRVNVTEVETGTVFTQTTTTTSITFQSLHPYYNYRCVISAYTVAIGPYTVVFSIRTPQDVPSGFPQSFSVQSTSSRSALLTWDPPNAADQNGIILEYTINVSAVETGEEFQLTSTTTSITVTTLRPYTTYLCIIAASTTVGIGPFSTVFTIVTPEDVPTSAPQVPSGYAVSSTSVFFSWDAPPVLERHGIIREYRINLTEQETGALLIYTTSNTSIEVSLLHPFYTYNWIVTAVTIGVGPYTTSNSVVTLEDVPSGAPLSFSPAEVTSRNFTLIWELPAPSERNGIITGYNISVTSLSSPFEDSREFFTTSLTYFVDSLDPYTNYVCIIAANTVVGIGPVSVELNIRTDPEEPGAPPSNTTGVALNSTHVYLTWDPPPSDQINGVIQGYRISVIELDTGDMSQYTVGDTETTIGPLHPHYTYNFSIVAFTSVGEGPTTYVVVRMDEAAPSSAPVDFQAAASDQTLISLSWDPPAIEDQNGIIRHYEVTLIALETGEIHIRTSTALFITVTSLRPYTTYNCTVAAETVATGPSAIGIFVQTPQTAPSGPPEQIQVMADDSRTLRLIWQPPENRSRNGIIQRYIINITELNTGSSFQLETTDLFLVVDSLHPYYQYSCIVAAETVELGPFSIAVIIELPEDAPSSSPRELSISMATSTSFYLSWSEPPLVDQNGLIRQYLINIIELDTGTMFTYSTTATEFTAEFLHPYYYYTCSVSAVTVSAGPYSSTQTIQTDIDIPSGPPRSTDIIDNVLSSTSLLLMWEIPLPEQQNGPIVGYTVRVVRVDNGDTVEFDTTNTTLMVDSLVPYTSYEWTVAARTSVGTGPFSSPVTERTLQDAPDDAPQDVVDVSVGSRLIMLSWSPPPAETHNGEIVHYVVTTTEIQTGQITVTMSFNTQTTLGNLHPFYNYTIIVAAFTINIGPPSTSITIQTLEDVPSAPPTDLSAVSQSPTVLNIAWVPPESSFQNGIIRSYVVTVSVIETGNTEQLTSDQPQLTIEGLHPFYTYSFLIAAVTVGPGPFSEVLSIQMPQAAPVGYPQNISVSIVSSVAITVMWQLPLPEDQNGIITSYTIQLYDTVTGETTLYQREGHHSQFLIDTLHPYYEYDVSMAAETVEIGPFSATQRFQTPEGVPSAAPRNLTVSAVDSRSLLLSWLPPPLDTQNGVIRDYIITIYVVETRESLILFSQGTQLMFNTAHPYYTYTIAVAAETIGPGPYGAEFTIRMPEDVPTGVPLSVEAVAVSSSSIRITWNPPLPEQQNGVIGSYYINVTELPTGIVLEIVAHGDESIEIVNLLHPYYVYECTIAAFTVGLGPTAFAQALTDTAVPSDVPQNVVAEPLNATHAQLVWDPPPPEHRNGIIELYIITITATDTDEQFQEMSMYNTTIIGSLHPFYTYKFSIAAQTIEIGPFTSPVIIQMPPSAPSGVASISSVKVESASSVTVTWTPPDIRFWNGIITSYTVVYELLGPVDGDTRNEEGSALAPFQTQTITIPRPGLPLVNSPDPRLVSLPLRQESVLIEELEEYHVYSFAVYMENTEGESGPSETATKEMPPGVPDGSPTNVMIEVLSSTSVLIKWDPPELLHRNGIITKYSLIVNFVKNETVQRYTVPATTLSVQIEGVQKYSTVSVQIAAETIVGVGPLSDVVSNMTFQDLPCNPKEVETKLSNDTGINLSFLPPDCPNGVIIEYQVRYYGYKPLETKEKRDDDVRNVEILDGPKVINISVTEENPVSTLIITGLIPGLSYDIQVRARTERGYGNYSSPVTFMTQQPQTGGSTTGGSSLSGGIIAVIILVIVSVIGWILVVVFAIYFFRRRHASHTAQYEIPESNFDQEMGTFRNRLFDRDSLDQKSIPEKEDTDLDEKPRLDFDEPLSDEVTNI